MANEDQKTLPAQEQDSNEPDKNIAPPKPVFRMDLKRIRPARRKQIIIESPEDKK